MLSACSGFIGKDTNKNAFGDFSYHGVFLKEYAKKQITLEEAKGLIHLESNRDLPSNKLVLDEDEQQSYETTVNTLLTKYGSMTTMVKYYIDTEEKQQVRQDIYQGTDFYNLLDINHYEPFGQMSVRYLYVDSYLLDDMEEENRLYNLSENNIKSPFNNPYTYHVSDANNLVIQTHAFAELPASTVGGIGSTFRQDCELVFDQEGKINCWQASLGLYTSTPTGTVKEGYIFEVEFEWVEKIN